MWCGELSTLGGNSWSTFYYSVLPPELVPQLVMVIMVMFGFGIVNVMFITLRIMICAAITRKERGPTSSSLTT